MRNTLLMAATSIIRPDFYVPLLDGRRSGGSYCIMGGSSCAFKPCKKNASWQGAASEHVQSRARWGPILLNQCWSLITGTLHARQTPGKYVFDVTSIGHWSSPWTYNLVKVEIKLHLECKLHFPSAQLILRQINSTNVSESCLHEKKLSRGPGNPPLRCKFTARLRWKKVAAGNRVKTGPLVCETVKSLKKCKTIFSLVLLASLHSPPCCFIA